MGSTRVEGIYNFNRGGAVDRTDYERCFVPLQSDLTLLFTVKFI